MSALAPIGDKTLRGPFVRDVPEGDIIRLLRRRGLAM
jgi:hypothetical protein